MQLAYRGARFPYVEKPLRLNLALLQKFVNERKAEFPDRTTLLRRFIRVVVLNERPEAGKVQGKGKR